MQGKLRERPFLHLMPWFCKDILDCLDFIDRQPWGDSSARLRDIDAAMEAVIRWPTLGRVRVRRPVKGLELRERRAAQFSVIYAYFPPGPRFPAGCVSFRAVRHRRVRNVFHGVKESKPIAYG